MESVSYIVVFSSIWWIIFYMVLPFGVKTPAKPILGHADSAPINPKLGIKILITTIISAIVTWAVIYLLESGYLKFLIGE